MKTLQRTSGRSSLSRLQKKVPKPRRPQSRGHHGNGAPSQLRASFEMLHFMVLQHH